MLQRITGGIILENVQRKSNKVVVFILQILGFVILIGGVFFGTYYLLIQNSSNSYEKNIGAIIKELNSINNAMGTYNSGQALDAKKLDELRKNLPKYVEELTKVKDKFEQAVPSEKYKADYDNLILGIEKNILIFRQTEAILRDPEGKDVGIAAENLEKYRDECLSYYSKITSKKMMPSLSSEFVNFVSNTLNYANEMGRLSKDREIILNQNIEFVQNMDLIISKFSPIKIDFSVELTKARNENGSLNKVISLVSKNSDELYNLKQEFSSISVPSKALEAYKLLKKTIEDYESYLQKFTYSVKNESLLGHNPSNEEINNLYKDCTSAFKTVTKDYDNFLKAYTEFKDSNLQ